MKWIGIYPTVNGTHITEAMITASRRFKIWNDYCVASGKYAGTWQGNLALIRNSVGTVLRRSDDIKGVTLVDPEIDNIPKQYEKIKDNTLGALATAIMDWAGWDTPFHFIPFSLLVKFSIGKTKKDHLKAMEDRALSEYNYRAKCTDAAIAFWASMFCASIDYPQLEKFRVELIDKFKKTKSID